MKTTYKLIAAGLLCASLNHALATVHYVDVNSTNATPPYINWAMAATKIQDAVDSAVSGDEIVVTNGTYATGGRAVYGAMTNRVAVDKAIALWSVNGPQFTIIEGYQMPGTTNGDGAIRCVYLTNGATLSGFTLTNGATRFVSDFRESSGGGLWCESIDAVVVSNCVMTGNSAYSDGGGTYLGTLNNCVLGGNLAHGFGGGAAGGILNNCTLSTNSSSSWGGGASGCLLNNCTLSGNSADTGGGAAGSALVNCTLAGNSASEGGGAAGNCCGGTYQSRLDSCTLTGNRAFGGGGAYQSTLNNCTLSTNLASEGGGAVNSTLNNCTLTGNVAYGGYYGGYGGGASYCTLNYCTLIGNVVNANPYSGGSGGGAYYGTLNNCILTGNSAPDGGGAAGATLKNCVLSGNLAGHDGGGAFQGALNNCTLTGNSASDSGGGATSNTLNNCIVYYNAAPRGANYGPSGSTTLNFCCTTPQPTTGVGNISFDPQLASASHLSAASPCRGAGNPAYATGTDIDGDAWANPPSIGCDEYHAGAVSGPLTVGLAASFTNVVIGFTVQFTALIEGRTTASVWDFGDGTTATNLPLTSHAWTAVGDYLVALRAYNESQPGGISATVTVHVLNGVHYVASDSPKPLTPYSSWATAATNIQDAIAAAIEAGAQVVVTNGTYSPISAFGLLTVRSVNGPPFTAINGGQSNQCAVLGTNVTLTGFMLTNAGGHYWGGGASGGTLSNCVVSGNSADFGGGAYQSTLDNCTLTGNSAQNDGGGAYQCILNNCAVSGNSAYVGGGAIECTLNNCTLSGNSAASYGGGEYNSSLNNCIAYFNTAPEGANYYAGTLNYSCTTPPQTNGVGNISSDPQLASPSHLSAASPCRAAGNAAYATGADIDGEAWATPPSIGCDEYYAGAVTGPLSVGIAASFTTVLTGYMVQFTASIEGRTTSSVWDLGDGMTVTNQPYTSHAWTTLGDYPVVLRAFNESQPGGISATVTVHVVTQPIHYVTAGSVNAAAPYTSWATAAGDIQDAVDAATVPGALVLVTNGTYAPIAVFKLLTLRSVNGPLFTTINGAQSNQCASLRTNVTLTGFTLTNGFSDYGGGASNGILNNCILSGNSAVYAGGGSFGSTLNNCTLSDNSAGDGGGAYNGTLSNCALTGNSAGSGGAAFFATLNNCTLTGNTAWDIGGGTVDSTLNNCIIYFNTAPQAPNYDPDISTFNYCCTTPLPFGAGNISADPQLASVSHLSAGSPCRGAGNALYANGTDIDGEAWGGPPSIGCDEYHAGAVTGPLTLNIGGPTNVHVGVTVTLSALIVGRTSASEWDFGDGLKATNQPAPSHVWMALGDYAVILRAYNESQPGGISATVTVHVVNQTFYVASGNVSPVAPYNSWATAATNIQNVIDTAIAGDEIVVTNGSYAPIATLKVLMLRSVNGPLFTAIDGSQSNQCASLGAATTLTGFALTNGTLGAVGGTLNNCILSGNSSGGASGCTLNNCVLTGNSGLNGGGARSSLLNNSTLTANSAANSGGGAYSSTLNNCIAWFNTAPEGTNYDTSSTLNYCCTTPLPTNGVGNILLDPQLASASHLSAGSPCRGAGNAAYATGTDIDGEAWASPPSIGCDEYNAGGLTGSLSVAFAATYTTVVAGFTVQFSALIDGRTTGSVWDFGDGITATNQPYTAHAWAALGDYAVVLRAFNESQPSGVSATVTVHVVDDTHYVASGNSTPVPPYTSWATAATNIQDAVDAASVPGALVLVTNGNYLGGWHVINGTTNRVAIDKILTVRSANGPQVTAIDGGRSFRCAYLTNGASLSGFALTNGFGASYGGGAFCESVSAVITNCVLAGNSASSYGGGVYGGLVINCAVTGNSGYWGGGAAYCTLTNCALTGNSAYYAGGGAYVSVLNSCALTGNSAYGYYGSGDGGGAYSCALNNCTLTGNSAQLNGGGANSCTLNNCALSGNSAQVGGGADYGALTNCTLTGNSANYAGGAHYGTLNNCIIYFNTASQEANYAYSTLNYCCASPQPTNGTGNISLDPLLASSSHLSAASPCRGAGNAAWASGTDIDDEPWANPPSIGCDEYYPAALTGPLSVSVTATYTNVAAGFPVSFTALVQGAARASSWDFGDGEVVSNRLDVIHAWAPAGDYAVVLRAYNESFPVGISATVILHVVNSVLYVAADSSNPVPPYTSWSMAATNIQDAVDAAAVPGALVLVTNGIYATGGRLTVGSGTTNRAAVDKPLSLRSVNGPQWSIIQGWQIPGSINGNGAIRCVFLTNGASLSGFTLTSGATQYGEGGGGVWCSSEAAVVSNCVVAGNSAGSYFGGVYGGTLNNCTVSSNSNGGAYQCTLNNCTLAGNSGSGAQEGILNNCLLTGNSGYGAASSTLNNCSVSANSYGGAYTATLNNCTLTGNSGLGVYSSTLHNCIVYFNTGGNYSGGTLSYCCTTPLPPGDGNISADPELTDSAHVSSDSPCVAAGNNAFSQGVDIDGQAWANPPSIGCDEFNAGAVTGPLAVSIAADYTDVTPGFAVNFTAQINGHATVNLWDFDDGTFVINQAGGLAHSFASLGDYRVMLFAYNDSHPAGVSTSLVIHVEEGLRYVSAANTNPLAPYDSWATAVPDIQTAVGAAPPGGTVLVTNGTYLGGVSLYKPLTVRSINGPQVTTISGGGGSRCATLIANASLSGFTLLNGFANGYGGGAYGGTLTNCILTGNVAEASVSGHSVCLSYDPLYHFCRLIGFVYSAGDAYGGGAYGCTLNNCSLSGNSVRAPVNYSYYGYYSSPTYSAGNAYGGGAAYCTLNNCTVTGNQAQTPLRDFSYGDLDNNGGYGRVAGGGGVFGCTLTNCVLSNNHVEGYESDFEDPYDPFDPHYIYLPGYGGGGLNSTLNNCTLAANSASDSGGGVYECALANCALTGNIGDGAIGSRLVNCTLTGNSGAGALGSTLTNCIDYFNGAGNYDSYCALNYCCTTPVPTNGVGNISSDPELASASHLSAFSPCIGKGNYAAVSGVDIDGEAWANPPSIGCDEYRAGAVTGPLSIAITASFTNVTVGYPVAFTGLIQGRTDLSLWVFGDGAVEINQPYVTHSWSATGDYLVSLWCFNESYPDGVSASVTLHVGSGVHYVAADSASPVAPYISWATAATNIQDAINSVEPGGSVMVTNGSYAPIHISGGLPVRSVNGARFTIVDGIHSNLCASLANSASLSGFTLTNGNGGASGGTLTNCILVGNSGSAAIGCTLWNCSLTGNGGGAASSCTLNNCTLTGNSGCGAHGCTLNNCIVYFNTAPADPNYSSSILNYCCTTPLPADGVGNISLDPLLASASHLSAASPCRRAGNATYAGGTDIDGEPWAIPPSIGCDEYLVGAVTGPLSAALTAPFTNVAVGHAVQLTALIDGRTTASVWDFGDGFGATNQPYTSHAWTTPGDYAVVLHAYNESQPGGVSATLTVRVTTGVHYVAPGSFNPTAPYLSWATAATNIQDAIDAAIEPGAQVLVTNGIYSTGGRAVNGTTNRVAIHMSLTVRSANGPQSTIIDGAGSGRCAYLTNDATLSGFTLRNGFVPEYVSGGGVFCESATAVISNCVVTGNQANGSSTGGGAYGGTLKSCTLTGNSAYYGGGAANCALNNCTLTGNRAVYGGGASGATLTNCTLNANSSSYGGGADGGTLSYCTVSSNSASLNGGGVYESTLNDCALIANRSPSSYPYGNGGAAYESSLNNCTLSGNSSGYTGGGACYGTLNNCTLIGNSTLQAGGGALFATLNNCILTANSAYYGGGAGHCSLNNCALSGNLGTGQYSEGPDAWNCSLNNCTFRDPLFVDAASGNLRLQSGSPCINAGNNSYVSGNTDLDGNPRIAGGTVDIGAYEFQCTGLCGFTAWLWRYGLPIDGTADYADPDGDGMNNWQEWIAGTDPTDAASALRLLTPVVTPPGLLLRWNSDTNHEYFVERTIDLNPPVSFSLLRTNVLGAPVITTFTDTSSPSNAASFYRIGTDSENASSPLWLQTPVFVPASVVLTWTSVADRKYFVESATNLSAPLAFASMATNIPGQPGTTSFTDTNTIGGGPRFYRVGVSAQ